MMSNGIEHLNRWEANQIRRSRAAIQLLIDDIGARQAVILLNEGLRTALDKLGEQEAEQVRDDARKKKGRTRARP